MSDEKFTVDDLTYATNIVLSSYEEVYRQLKAKEAKIERLRTLTEAYGELLDAVFDWLGCDSVQDQEKALVVVATKAHEVHKLTEGA